MIKIEVKDKILVYDFATLTIEQGEIAKEICEFKIVQDEAEATSINDVLRSGGAEWRIAACRYLFNIEGKPYNRVTAETEIDSLVRNLSFSEREKLEEAIKDFFSNIGQEQKALQLLRKQESNKMLKMLLPLVMKMNNSGKSSPNESDS